MAFSDNFGSTFYQILFEASFGGVPFEVTSYETSHEKRIVTHYFIEDTKALGKSPRAPYHQYLGDNAISHRINGFVIGDDYAVQRDILLETCKDSSPKTLIHPNLGIINAICQSVSISEDENLGIARFEMIFLEYSPLTFPQQILNVVNKLATSSQSIRSSLSKFFKG